MTDARPQGEPADLGGLPPFHLDTGAQALSDSLCTRYAAFRRLADLGDALSRQHRAGGCRREPGADVLVSCIASAHAAADRIAADMRAEFDDWLRGIAERARQDTAEGDDFGSYLDTVLTVIGDNDPDISEPALALQLLLRRALSGRKADRAEAQWFADLPERLELPSARDGITRPTPPWLAALADLSRQAKAKGRGKHRDDAQPDIDLALLLHHEGKRITDPHQRQLMRSYQGFGGTRPLVGTDEEGARFTGDKSIHKARARARRARDIAAQALCELRLLSGWNIPHLNPPDSPRASDTA
jgi:hypothetical protein